VAPKVRHFYKARHCSRGSKRKENKRRKSLRAENYGLKTGRLRTSGGKYLDAPPLPGQETSHSQREPGKYQQSGACRCHDSDCLPQHPSSLPGMSEAGPRSQLPSAVIAREGFPPDDFSCGTIKSELRSQIRPPAVSAIDRESECVRRRIRQAQADGGEVRDLLPGACKQFVHSVEAARTMLGTGSLAGMEVAFSRTLSCGLARRWRRIPSHAIEQIVGPRIRHDHARDHNQE